MRESQNNIQCSKDEIDIKELIITLWKRKMMIISFTVVCALIAVLISMFFISPVYDTQLNIIISMPETYSTRYGEYKLPLTSNEQYINLITSNNVLINTLKDMGYSSAAVSLEYLRNSISIGKTEIKSGIVQNSFNVTVSSSDPQESLKLAQVLYSNYLDFMDAMTKERVIEHYNNYFKVALNALENDLDKAGEMLKKNEELLAQTPQTISTGNSNIEIQTQLNDSSQYVIPINSINPNYIKVENDIIENKQSIYEIENTMRIYNNYLEEIEVESKAINQYYRTGESESLESNIISVVEANVYLPSPPVAPAGKTSPSIKLNAIAGAGIGLILGAVIVLFKEYWFSETKK